MARALVGEALSVGVSDIDRARANSLASSLGQRSIAPDTFWSEDVHAIAPCALGGVLDRTTLNAMTQASLVCGAANNILASPETERALRERGITWVPDVIASAGAVVRGIAKSVMRIDDPTPMVARLGDIAHDVLHEAQREGRLASEIVLDRVQARMSNASVALQVLDD